MSALGYALAVPISDRARQFLGRATLERMVAQAQVGRSTIHTERHVDSRLCFRKPLRMPTRASAADCEPDDGGGGADEQASNDDESVSHATRHPPPAPPPISAPVQPRRRAPEPPPAESFSRASCRPRQRLQIVNSVPFGARLVARTVELVRMAANGYDIMAFRPQPEVAEEALDLAPVLHRGDDFAFASAMKSQNIT